MIAAFLLYCLLASLLLGAVGYLLEHAARLLSFPARAPWAGALVLLLSLVVSAPLRGPAAASFQVDDVGPTVVGPAAMDGRVGVDAAPTRLGVGGMFDAALRWAVPLARGTRGLVLAVVWGALSALVLGVGLAVVYRAWRQRRRWPRAVLLGETVRIVPRDGPAVVGFLRPEILVPRWLMEVSEERQRMAIQHEREHLRAGDPYLLAVAALATVLLPWNPVVWWIWRRLRLAIELDCDRRVLRQGVRPREYASFLIDAATLGTGRLHGAVTLAPSTSTLSRRLRAMTDSKPRHALTRAALVAVLGGVALAAACESRLPTQAEIDAMDASAAEVELRELLPALEVGGVGYFVDGTQVTQAVAKAVPAENIASVEVLRGPDGDRIAIRTKDAAEGADASFEATEIAEQAAPRGALRSRAENQPVVKADQSFQGLVVVDGEVVASERLRTLRPDDIESVEVIKGKAAGALYPQPQAAQGVLRITTKRNP